MLHRSRGRIAGVTPVLIVGLIATSALAAVASPTSGTARANATPTVISVSTLPQLRPASYHPDRIIGSMVASGGSVYSSGEKSAAASDTYGVERLDRSTLARRWFVNTDIYAAPGVGEGLVVQANGADIYVLRARTGKVVWHRSYGIDGDVSGSNAAPLIYRHRVFAVDGSGHLWAFQASNGRRLWVNFDPASYLFGAGGKVYGYGPNQGAGYTLRTGKLISYLPQTLGRAAYSAGVFYYADVQYGDELVAQPLPCLSRCRPSWSVARSGDEQGFSNVFVHSNRVFADEGSLRIAEHTLSGKLLRHFAIPSSDISDLTDIVQAGATDDVLFAMTDDDELLGFSLHGCGHGTCSPIWMVNTTMRSEYDSFALSADAVLVSNGLTYRLVGGHGPFSRATAPTGVQVNGSCGRISANWPYVSPKGGLQVSSAEIRLSDGLYQIDEGGGSAAITVPPGTYQFAVADRTAWGTGAFTENEPVTVTSC